MPDAANHRPIVIAYDGSGHARSAIVEAARLFPGRPALVVSAWRSVADVMGASLVALPAAVAKEAGLKLDQAARDEAQSLSDEGAALAREGGLDARAQAIEAQGAIWPSIVSAADEIDAAAVVVGSRGRSPIRSALVGSVSAGVVHNSSRPVLIVTADKDAEPEA